MDDDTLEAAEVHEALETTDALHNDISRLKRMQILTPEEDQRSKGHLKAIEDTLEHKLDELK